MNRAASVGDSLDDYAIFFLYHRKPRCHTCIRHHILCVQILRAYFYTATKEIKNLIWDSGYIRLLTFCVGSDGMVFMTAY